MKLLQFNNKSLLLLATEVGLIKTPVSAGTNVSVTIDDNSDLAQNDYVLVGVLGKPKSEIAKISAAVTPGTTIVLDTLVFPHNAGTPITKIPYNQLKIYRAETLAGEKTLLTTAEIDADNEYTTYADTINSTGFAFFTLYNSTTATESGYSAGFDYAEVKAGTKIKIRTLVENFYKRPYDETTFGMLCDLAESEIFAMRRWRFREASGTFNTVANQQSYTAAQTGISDLGQMVYATYGGNPIVPVDIKKHKLVNWQPVAVGTPRIIWEWDGVLYISPTPTEIKTVVVDYYKNSSGFTDETAESEVQLPQAIAFRVLQDLWATADPRKSSYFEKRYLQVIAAMKLNDIKQMTKFQALTDNRIANLSVYNQVNSPTIKV